MWTLLAVSYHSVREVSENRHNLCCRDAPRLVAPSRLAQFQIHLRSLVSKFATLFHSHITHFCDNVDKSSSPNKVIRNRLTGDTRNYARLSARATLPPASCPGSTRPDRRVGPPRRWDAILVWLPSPHLCCCRYEREISGRLLEGKVLPV